VIWIEDTEPFSISEGGADDPELCDSEVLSEVEDSDSEEVDEVEVDIADAVLEYVEGEDGSDSESML